MECILSSWLAGIRSHVEMSRNFRELNNRSRSLNGNMLDGNAFHCCILSISRCIEMFEMGICLLTCVEDTGNRIQ